MCIVLQTKGISWQVPTGRRDGRVSLSSDTNNLPGFTESIDSQKQKFAAKGLNTQDLVTLVGNNNNYKAQIVYTYIIVKNRSIRLKPYIKSGEKKC